MTIPRFALALLVVVILAPLAVAAPFDGAWVAVMAESDGKPAPQVKGHVLRIQGDKFAITLKDKVLYEGTFKIDASAKPPTIDFTHTAGQAKDKTWKGIYALEKDSLKICDNAPDTTKPRPTELKGLAGYTCVTFQRLN